MGRSYCSEIPRLAFFDRQLLLTYTINILGFSMEKVCSRAQMAAGIGAQQSLA
jgi:hypothetical protein